MALQHPSFEYKGITVNNSYHVITEVVFDKRSDTLQYQVSHFANKATRDGEGGIMANRLTYDKYSFTITRLRNWVQAQYPQAYDAIFNGEGRPKISFVRLAYEHLKRQPSFSNSTDV